MRMFSLGSENVEAAWADFAEIAERLSKVGDISVEALKTHTATGHMQVWGLQDHECIRGIAVTEIIDTPSGRICTISGATGDVRVPMQERLLDEIGSWAQSIGCRAVRISGRKGWLRRFPRFHATGIVAEWELGTMH